MSGYTTSGVSDARHSARPKRAKQYGQHGAAAKCGNHPARYRLNATGVTHWPCVRNLTEPISAHRVAVSAGRRLAARLNVGPLGPALPPAAAPGSACQQTPALRPPPRNCENRGIQARRLKPVNLGGGFAGRFMTSRSLPLGLDWRRRLTLTLRRVCRDCSDRS